MAWFVKEMHGFIMKTWERASRMAMTWTPWLMTLSCEHKKQNGEPTREMMT